MLPSPRRERRHKVTRRSHGVPLPPRTPREVRATPGWTRPPTPRWAPGSARSQPAGRGRARGGLSAPILAVQGAPLPRPRLGRARPGRPDSRDFPTLVGPPRPPPRHPVPGAPLPTAAAPHPEAPEKPPPARSAPSDFPAGLPSRSAAPAGRELRLLPTGITVAHPLRVATHLGSRAALPPPQTSADK